MRKQFKILLGLCLLVFFLHPLDASASEDLNVQKWLDRPGTRLVVVEFYATWCGPCMKAVPKWQKLYNRYHDQGLRLIVVNTQDPGGCENPGWTPDQNVCDPDGYVAQSLGVGNRLPAAFLWSWQGNLLVQRGHVDNVTEAVEKYFQTNPRVLVEAYKKNKRPYPALLAAVRTELQRLGKFSVVASEAERSKLRQLRKKSHQLSYDSALACELGKEVSANSLLEARIVGQRLYLKLLSAESSCLIASSSARFKRKRMAAAVAEAVDALLAKIKRNRMQRSGKAQPHGTKAVVEKSPGDHAPSWDWNSQKSELFVIRFAPKPEGSVVTVDGKLLCVKTPCSKALSSGPHTVLLQAERYEALRKTLDVTAASSVDWALVPSYGFVSVDSEPSGLDVKIDDEVVGQTPLKDYIVDPGLHQILLDSECYYDAGQQINIKKGQHRSVKLKPDSKLAGIEVRAQDDVGNDVSADVFVDGDKLGRAPGRFKVSVCAEKLKVNSDSAGEFSQNLSLEEHQVEHINARLNTAEMRARALEKIIWRDPTTGLYWQKEPLDREYTWSGAKNYCEQLELGGHSDWTLPSREQLSSLLRGCKEGICPHHNGPGSAGCYWPADIGGRCGLYWSATQSDICGLYCSATQSDISRAWEVDFDVGYDLYAGNVYDSSSKAGSGRVRCVRLGP